MASSVSEEELGLSAESSKTAAEEASNKVASEEDIKRAALMKAVIEGAAQGEASRVEAIVKHWGSAIEAGLWKAPQTRKFLEEDLPRVSVSCQAGFEPGGALKS